MVTKDLADEGIATCSDGGYGEAPLLLPLLAGIVGL